MLSNHSTKKKRPKNPTFVTLYLLSLSYITKRTTQEGTKPKEKKKQKTSGSMATPKKEENIKSESVKNLDLSLLYAPRSIWWALPLTGGFLSRWHQEHEVAGVFHLRAHTLSKMLFIILFYFVKRNLIPQRFEVVS